MTLDSIATLGESAAVAPKIRPTFKVGFHDEERVRNIRYNRLGGTDMVVSNYSLGSCSFGELAKLRRRVD